jgi:cyclic-di-GMP phosphodiesterase TipF (flagellum assembly factor)
VQALVYTFIAAAAVSLGAAAYFGLTFTLAESILAGLVFGSVCFIFMERRLRDRAESRLERAIEDLSRLLATDAQAGNTLGQRINALADLNIGQRLSSIEADISVLGTVIRQVAEAVADVEEKLAKQPAPQASSYAKPAPSVRAAPPREIEPVIPLSILREALSHDRLVYFAQPVVTLPQRRAQGYDLVPRLKLDNGSIAEAADFMPLRGGEDAVIQIEALALLEAITIARRARTNGQQATLYVPLSRATVGNSAASDQLLATIEANRTIAPGLIFVLSESNWLDLTIAERAILEAIAKKGAGFSLSNVRSLRVDISELSQRGVRSLRIDAGHFIDDPQSYTDFHAADIANYLARFEIKLMATGIASERQIVEILEDGITLAQGSFIGAPTPIRGELTVEPTRSAAPLRRVEA